MVETTVAVIDGTDGTLYIWTFPQMEIEGKEIEDVVSEECGSRGMSFNNCDWHVITAIHAQFSANII